jgi:hypothetical protein
MSDDSICVHFVFKCKMLDDAYILGELYYIISNTISMPYHKHIGSFIWLKGFIWYPFQVCVFGR